MTGLALFPSLALGVISSVEFGASREEHLTGLPCFSRALEDSMEDISRMFLATLHIYKEGQEQNA